MLIVLPMLTSADGADEKAVAFQAIMYGLMDQCFCWKTTTRKANEEPWVDDYLKKLWKRRRKVYDRDGRSTLWRTLTRKASNRYRKRMGRFLDIQKKILTAGDASRSFFKYVKTYSCREKPPDFDIRSLYPDQSDAEVAEELSKHFNAISSEFQGLRDGDVPPAAEEALPSLSRAEVSKRLSEIKKPRGGVRGDIFPSLVSRSADVLAVPLTNIYNTISTTATWPQLWKTEFVTPIPKTSLPQSANDLRNISCTMLFSKVYESFVLSWLTAQIGLRHNQFGGVKGCWAEHLLVRMWLDVLEAIEDPRSAVLLTSIDFAKAFNRLDFRHCLTTLRNKGATSGVINVISSFLTNRQMQVKVGNTYSQPRSVLGGVPQGSILGVYLFNCSIDSFESGSHDVKDYPGGTGTKTLAPEAPGPDHPVPDEPTYPDYRHLPPFLRIPVELYKYVDDNVILEKLNFDTVVTDGRFVREKWAVRTENLFCRVVHQAIAQGMKVNCSKTKALLISELKSYLPAAFFRDNQGGLVKAGDEMKVLGVCFCSDPGMAAQVSDIKRKFISRIWALRHLGRLGMGQSDLLAVYKSTILPMHDYCLTVFNSTLTLTQSGQLERLQAMALKAIYGYDQSYRSLLSFSGLTSLKARRDTRGDRFALKCLQNPRFSGWFLPHVPVRPTRNPLLYEEYKGKDQAALQLPPFSPEEEAEWQGGMNFMTELSVCRERCRECLTFPSNLNPSDAKLVNRTIFQRETPVMPLPLWHILFSCQIFLSPDY